MQESLYRPATCLSADVSVSLLAVWVQPLVQFLLVSSPGIGLRHGVDDGEQKVDYHHQKEVAKHCLESTGLLCACVVEYNGRWKSHLD